MAVSRSTLMLGILISQSMVLCAGVQQKPAATPDPLATAIEKAAPGAVVVDKRDVDEPACNPVGESPGLVRADFDGDGRPDYAVLLKTKETGKTVSWEGRKLREARFALAFFLDDGKGAYLPRIARRYTDFIPTATVLDLQPAGTVHHHDTQESTDLKNPAVTLSFCEKSAVIFFVADSKVHSIPVAD